MRLIKPSFEILQFDDNVMIERAGRTCYKSEDKITEGSADKFAEMLIKRSHEAMIEFGHATVRIICDRGITHEIVRHRLFSFAQESTRYCNYGKAGKVTFIIPLWVSLSEGEYNIPAIQLDNPGDHQWYNNVLQSERTYLDLLAAGWTPQQARTVLPNSLKTEIVCKANFREWRHFFRMRDDEAAHPQMREIAGPLHEEFRRRNPYVFN